MNTEKKIALIIDCDNARADAIYGIMAELSAFGEISIRRAYGDWSKQNSWQEILHPFAIQPIQQFPYTSHKNATDLAMTIDAMEILFTENVDYFAIVSSDSDFTPLAMKLRAKSKQVIGFGEDKTPQAFIHSCNSFIYIDKFEKPNQTDVTANKIEPFERNKLRGNSKIMNAIRQAIHEEADDNNWALASKISQRLLRQISLSPKNFGYKTWPILIRATEYFDENKNSKGQLVFRIKKK